MPFTNGFDLPYAEIDFGSNCISDLSGRGVQNDAFEIDYPDFDFGSNCISDLSGSGVFNDAFDFDYQNFDLGENYPGFIGPGVFDQICTELWNWAVAPGPPVIVTEARTDPLTGPYTSTFYPAQEIVVGKLFDFEGTPRYGRAPLEVDFTDLCPPFVTQWLWYFGDGHQSIAQNPVHAYEFPGIYDVTLWVYVGATWYEIFKRRYITVWPGSLRVAQTNICWRRAMKTEQGIGWTRYTGNFIFPESHVGTIKIIDTNNQVSWLIFDTSTGRPYILANRDGPPGSNITKEFRDKVTNYGGQEISSRITLKEHTGKDENPLRHEVSRVFLRPYSEANKGADGYGSNGQRTNQAVTIRAYLGGNLTESAEARDIPDNGEISLDKKLQDPRIQMEYALATSEFKIVGFSQNYLYLDKKGPPDEIITSEQQWQNEFGLPVLWLSRGPTLLMDRATGTVVGGSSFGVTTGPDGKTQSAMAFSAATGLSRVIGNLTSNFSLHFSISSITATTQVLSFSVGAGRVRVTFVGGTYSLEYADTSGTYTQPLSWDGTGWVTLTVAREGAALRFIEDGVHLQQFSLPSIVSIGGTVGIMTAQVGSVFDLRILAAALSTDAASYYHDDLVNNSGNSFLPMW